MGTTGQSITLANSIIGVGILAMPFCYQQCGVLLATLILIFMGLVSRLCCYFLLKSALISRRRNFEFLAFHVFGPAGKLAVEVGIIGFLMGTCIAYFVVVGDLGPQIISKMFNINQSDILRTSIMVIVSLVCVLPLGLLRNVDSLSNVSAATIGFYFCLVIKVIEEAASQLWAGDWHTRVVMWRPAGLLQCVPIFSMALFCQTQLFEIFESLPSLSLEKMSVVTKNAINICKSVYFTLGLFGYIAFSSQNISGNILMSLSPTMANDVIKLGFVMSLAFSFPLIIFPCRASIYSFLYKKVHSSHHDHIINHSIPETTFRCITVAIIAVALFVSLLIPNIELVLGLVGSTIGVLICVVFPAACFVNVTFKNTNERILAKGIVVLGLVIMVLGTYANLQAAENQVDKYDEKFTQERIDKIVEDFFEKWDKNDHINGKTEVKNEKVIEPQLNEAVKDKDSEVQPPNPVPPESASNEKHDAVIKPLIKLDDKKLEEIKLQPIPDKTIEGHPKNLNTKLNEIKSNGDVVNNKVVAEKPPDEEKPKIPSLQEKTLEKIDIMKQQKLIETIKQHGEQQKELMKEQKEILDEIIKTKKEIEQNKKDKPDLDSVEAKKIAVESIQKIANVAIKSLSGVTDKPVVQQGQESKPLQEIANEAVQEIAKKAVESIVAINEINEKPKQNVENKVHPIKNVAVQQNVINQGQNQLQNVPVAPNPNLQPIVQIQNDAPKVDNTVNQVKIEPDAKPLITQNANPQSANIAQPIAVQNNAVKSPVEPAKVLATNNNQQLKNNGEIIQPAVNQQPSAVPIAIDAANVVKQPAQSVNQPNQNAQPTVAIPSNQPVNVPNPDNVNNVQQVANQNNNNNNIPSNNAPNLAKPNNEAGSNQNQKPHLHSADEPQSYKLGEDSQLKSTIQKNIADNVPLPIAIKAQAENADIQAKFKRDILQVDQKILEASENFNGAKASAVENVRQKREVVDCTEKLRLQPEDKEICEALITGHKIQKHSEEILPSKVDLNDVLERKNIDVIHHVRSLKSVDET